MIVRVRAPLRISFCGGGTDVSPFLEEHGGVVLSTTINKYAYASLSERDEDGVGIQSLDFDVSVNYGVDEVFRTDGELALLRGVLKRFELNRGVDIFLHSDAPPGSGLGSSSTMCVAMVALLKKYLGVNLGKYAMAELAYDIERKDLGIKGGKQDQYAAAFGGFNLIEFHADRTVVNPLRIEPYIARELQYHLLLCFTGRTRLSDGLIDYQVDRFKRAEKATVDALHELKRLTYVMKDTLVRGELARFGELLHEAFLAKQEMNPRSVPPEILRLYEIGRSAGAVGGKILGAGGGGYLLFFCDFRRKHHVARALEAAGGRISEFDFVGDGAQTWFMDGTDGTEAEIPSLKSRALRFGTKGSP